MESNNYNPHNKQAFKLPLDFISNNHNNTSSNYYRHVPNQE